MSNSRWWVIFRLKLRIGRVLTESTKTTPQFSRIDGTTAVDVKEVEGLFEMLDLVQGKVVRLHRESVSDHESVPTT